MIKVYTKDSREYGLLQKAAMLFTAASPNRYRYYVGDVYFDYGQDWKWTTIICSHGYQALDPVEHEQICESDGNLVSLATIVENALNDKYCPDKSGIEVKEWRV